MIDNPLQPPPAKKPYLPPTLIVHGTLEEITRGGTFNGGNGGGATSSGATGSHVNVTNAQR